jgi:serine/threonine protein phosphatase PrpC
VANINKIHNRRKSSLMRKIYPLQLTQDHAPEEPEELARIKSSGGKVHKMIDDAGNKVGPHRVWSGNQNLPGLGVSRSFGDQVGKSIGIISDPTCWMHQVDKDMDLFLVVASDGVWNVMDNEDVTGFVESVRFVCAKKIVKERGDNVNLYNSTVAQLLCEEARFRWITFVEQDDVPIDDISCIVVEFNMSFTGKSKAITLKQKPKAKKEVRFDED